MISGILPIGNRALKRRYALILGDVGHASGGGALAPG